MNKIPLSDYAKEKGQVNTAKALGVTQGAISRALITGRNIFVFSKEGKLYAEEVRPFPSVKK